MSDAQQQPADWAREERKVAARLDMSGHRLALLGGALVIVLTWFLPYTGNITGIDIALVTPRSVDYGIASPERMYVWLCALGPVALTVATYFLKSTRLAQVNWIISGITMFFAVFAIWMRQTREQGSGPSIGLIMSALAVVVVVYGLYNVVTLRSEEQEIMAEQRRKNTALDPIAQEQQNLLEENKQHAVDETAALVDDRRRRSAERRRDKRDNSER